MDAKTATQSIHAVKRKVHFQEPDDEPTYSTPEDADPRKSAQKFQRDEISVAKEPRLGDEDTQMGDGDGQARDQEDFIRRVREIPKEALRDLVDELQKKAGIPDNGPQADISGRPVRKPHLKKPAKQDTVPPPTTVTDDAHPDEHGRDIDGMAAFKTKAFNIGHALCGTEIKMNIMQFLNASPDARHKVNKWMTAAMNKSKGRKRPRNARPPVVSLLSSRRGPLPLPRVSQVKSSTKSSTGNKHLWLDTALTSKEIGHNNWLGYIPGQIIGSVKTSRILIDSGSNLDCVSKNDTSHGRTRFWWRYNPLYHICRCAKCSQNACSCKLYDVTPLTVIRCFTITIPNFNITTAPSPGRSDSRCDLSTI